jgi:hypothetical protein
MKVITAAKVALVGAAAAILTRIAFAFVHLSYWQITDVAQAETLGHFGLASTGGSLVLWLTAVLFFLLLWLNQSGEPGPMRLPTLAAMIGCTFPVSAIVWSFVRVSLWRAEGWPSVVVAGDIFAQLLGIAARAALAWYFWTFVRQQSGVGSSAAGRSLRAGTVGAGLAQAACGLWMLFGMTWRFWMPEGMLRLEFVLTSLAHIFSYAALGAFFFVLVRFQQKEA